jgi:very-short-patch-repair endonuclease
MKKKGKHQVSKELKQRKANRTKARKYSGQLKRRITRAERMVKSILDEDGIIYTFQKPFYSHNCCYIVDFYFENKLGRKYIIELDGKTHNRHTKAYDKNRSFFLYHKKECAVIRFRNEDVFNDIDKIIDKIYSLHPQCIDDIFM